MKKIQQLRLTLHLAGWLGLMAVPLLIFDVQPAELIFSTGYCCFVLTFIALYYIHSMWLLPGLYRQRQFLLYTLAVFMLLTGVLWLRPFDRLNHQHRKRAEREAARLPVPSQQWAQPSAIDIIQPKIDVISAFIFFVIIATGIAFETNRQLHLAMRRVLQAEKDRAEAELSFLKAQVNPHFLYNTLNNIYTLAITNDVRTPEMLLKLSGIMRYFTDEAILAEARLADELTCLRQYIELQSLRLSRKTTLDFRVEGDVLTKKIAPLLLMAFAENVFKYGVSNREESTILISLHAKADELVFTTRNRIFYNKKTLGAIGMTLGSTRKRLEELYPNRHFLNIRTDDGYFTVNLTIQV
ncbi:hypothetical protein C7T94_00950 [Pedobacter yulinensis]|uniref:Signal transduction histidine kinase internal region domain-containing protein n=1 Tax=Pedobacter yulinensis TaxID=2126353 RepID=A0A2T3HQQ6_9SPHI|nr:sensor histidine kinase [Pedobacter yulinensis]PST84733.1 hypothetical protein C7T94_00950 [Pedobacter yulinensis]